MPLSVKPKIMYDCYGKRVEYTKLKKPDAGALGEIRLFLKMTATHERRDLWFPVCRNRSWKTAVKLDTELGYSEEEIRSKKHGKHTRGRHVCPECRCRNTAGSGTRGWWYWGPDNDRGLPEVGHYGVGPCWFHSPMVKRRYGHLDRYVEMIAKEIKAMQEGNLAPDGCGKWLIDAKESKEVAEMKNQLRTTVDEARELLVEVKSKIEGQGLEVMMKDGSRVEADDVVKHKMLLDTIKAISNLAKNELQSSQWDYCHKDILTVLIGEFMLAAEMKFKAKSTTEEWNEFLSMLKDAGSKVQFGRQKR